MQDPVTQREYALMGTFRQLSVLASAPPNRYFLQDPYTGVIMEQELDNPLSETYTAFLLGLFGRSCPYDPVWHAQFFLVKCFTLQLGNKISQHLLWYACWEQIAGMCNSIYYYTISICLSFLFLSLNTDS